MPCNPQTYGWQARKGPKAYIGMRVSRDSVWGWDQALLFASMLESCLVPYTSLHFFLSFPQLRTLDAELDLSF
jgi:hypothetical protein